MMADGVTLSKTTVMIRERLFERNLFRSFHSAPPLFLFPSTYLLSGLI